ncbi:MAG: cytochrome c oxidase subunit 3 [Amylibacter sp.]|nr:cytochrome c oxidase subunit 3 [Amylibacter sp.]
MSNTPAIPDEQPGDLMMWVLIVSELLVFGAGLAAFMAMRITDPAGFAEAQSHLHRTAAGINTVILVTSGFFATQAVRMAKIGQAMRTRGLLLAAILLGLVFLGVKGMEFSGLASQGITTETHSFYTFYYLLTGFHAAHVLAGILILLLVGWKAEHHTVEVGTAFWHMVDLVWVLLFPVIYLLS